MEVPPLAPVHLGGLGVMGAALPGWAAGGAVCRGTLCPSCSLLGGWVGIQGPPLSALCLLMPSRLGCLPATSPTNLYPALQSCAGAGGPILPPLAWALGQRGGCTARFHFTTAAGESRR